MLQYAIYTAPGGALIADYSSRAQGVTFATNNRGFAECKAFIPLSLGDAFRLYDRTGLPHVKIADQSSGVVFEGRLEDVEITGGGVNLTAYGYARSMSDFPYTALWSDTSVAAWRPALIGEIVNGFPDRFTTDTNNRVYITAQKNATFGTTTVLKVGYMIYQIPDNSPRLITGLSFDYTGNGPANWSFAAAGYGPAFSAGANISGVFVPGGGPIAGSQNLTFAGKNIITFYLYFNAADAVYAGETGTAFCSFTNVRVVTSIANRVNTTLTVARAAGTNVTATVGSTANMYVGQLLTIGGGLDESVTVLSIGGSTTFNATFLNGPHAIGATVQAHVVYADEIVQDLVTNTNAGNPTQLSSSLALVQSPGRDLTDQTFIDAARDAILDTLATAGDNQTTPRQWEWGVQNGQVLYFRPQNTTGRTWYVDVSDLRVQRSIASLFNYVYATYQEAGGRRLRGTVVFDAGSTTRYGVLRQKAITTQTTSLTQANSQANAMLADTKDPKPRSGVTVDRIFDAVGNRWPLAAVRAGDTMILRNLPPTLSVAIDRIRVFRLSRAEYAIATETLTVEPELPLPSLDALMALALAPQTGNSQALAQAFLHGQLGPSSQNQSR